MSEPSITEAHPVPTLITPPALIACRGGFGCTRIATHKQSRGGHVSFKCWEHAYRQATSDFNVIRSSGFTASECGCKP